MSKYLVIVESPTKVKTIGKFLNKDYNVEATKGHIVDLPRSKMGVDVEAGFEPHYIVMTQKKKIVSALKKAAKGKEAVYLACDPDREGEAIAWHTANILNSKTQINRVSFNELTKDVVVEAFKHPGTIDMNKVNAQQARRILDRLVGYEISPLLWKKVVKGLSAGRVQSVAVRSLVEREREIEKFVAEEYWELEAILKKLDSDDEFSAKLFKINNKKPKIKTQAEAESICGSLKKADFIVDDIKTSVKKRRPRPPFITSTLQQAAFNKLRFTASRTMRLAQQLYEGVEIEDQGNVGLITYMRTDSVAISNTAQQQARDFIKKQYGPEYVPDKFKYYKSKKSAQAAHEAIRPTSIKRTPEEMKAYLNSDQLKLYALIWQQFVCACMKDARISVTTAIIKADKCLFKATGSQVLFEGFMKVDKQPEEKEKLPKLDKDEKLDLIKLTPSQHFTKPPPRFTDATLIKAMEDLGIGRPSTYAPTIRTIIDRNYIKREKRNLMPTELGTVVNDLLVENFPKVLDVQFTARMEEELDKVEQGELDWKQALNDFYEPFSENLEKAKTNMRSVKKEVEKTDEICEKCGRPMVIKWSRHGKFLSCSGFPECKNAKPITTGIPCPEPDCDGELVQRRSKRGRRFYGCTNYPKCTHISNKLPETK